MLAVRSTVLPVLALTSVLAAEPVIPTAASEATLEKLERRAAILGGVAVGFGVGGGIAMAIGLRDHEDRFTIGGAALVAIGVHVLVLCVVAWLWPDDSWLGMVTEQETPAPLASKWWP